MARTTAFIFGHITASNSVYDAADYSSKVRLHFCDKADDLPSGPSEFDLAIVINKRTLHFVKNGKWKEIGSKDEG